MKKSLLALAAMGAFAGAAQAQSSVTVYGILDVGYINQKSDGTGTTATTTGNFSALGQSAESTSRLGSVVRKTWVVAPQHCLFLRQV